MMWREVIVVKKISDGQHLCWFIRLDQMAFLPRRRDGSDDFVSPVRQGLMMPAATDLQRGG